MAEWIDGAYEVGHIGFLVRKSNPMRHTEAVLLTDRPAYTNQSHEPRLYGWCGAWNDTNTYGDGIARVVRAAKNGRCQIVVVDEREEVEAYLERVGFPDLLAQWDNA